MSIAMRQQIPFFVEVSPPKMRVVRLRNRSFHVYADGPIPLLLSASDALLVRGPLAELLRHRCATSAKFVRAIFANAETGSAVSTYVECVPHEEVTPENIASIAPAGFKVWHYARENMFLSEELVTEMQQHQWSESLTFSLGFSRFAAGV